MWVSFKLAKCCLRNLGKKKCEMVNMRIFKCKGPLWRLLGQDLFFSLEGCLIWKHHVDLEYVYVIET